VYALPDGDEVCGWKLSDGGEDKVKLAYEADAELVSRRKLAAAETIKIESLETQVDQYAVALGAEEDTSKVLQKRVDKLFDDLIKCNLKLENEKAKPRFGTPLAWGTSAVLGAILLGFVGASVID